MVHARPIIVQKPSFTVIIQKPLLTMISLTCTIRPPHNFRSFQWTTWFPWKTLLEIFHERLLCPFFETVSLHVCFVSSVSSRHHTILTDSNTAPPPIPRSGPFLRLFACAPAVAAAAGYAFVSEMPPQILSARFSWGSAGVRFAGAGEQSCKFDQQNENKTLSVVRQPKTRQDKTS